MKKFHVNPETGDPGECRAVEGYCPFGNTSQHFSSPEAARAAYEAQMIDYEDYRESPLGRLDSLANKAVTKLRSAMDKSVNWLDNNPKLVMGGVAVIAAAAVAVVAYKIAATHFRPPTSNPFQGVVTDGTNKAHIIGIPGKGGSVDMDSVYQVKLPDGSITEYVSKDRNILPDGSTVDLHLWSDGTIHENAAPDGELFNVASGAAGAVAGGGAGIASTFLARIGVNNLSDWLDAHWNLRHEERFGLLSWRTA